MPAKRRRDKRRATVPPEAWDMAFESGHDYLGDLDALGLIEPHRAPTHEQEAAEKAWMAALRAAWAEHGADFMRARDPHQHADPLPWAYEEFGDPTTCQ